MFVRPEARGLGVGRTIVVQLIEDARALGCETLVLESATFMHSAHALYRSVGFVPSDSYPGPRVRGRGPRCLGVHAARSGVGRVTCCPRQDAATDLRERGS